MASNDDIQCLSAICQALRDVVHTAVLTQESEDQVRELLALLPQVFATDTHVGRTAQLLQSCHPLQAVSQFLSTRFFFSPIIRHCAMRCISEVATCAAVTADTTERLKGLVAEQISEAGTIRHLISLVATAPSIPEASQAGQVLFVLAMTIRPIREDIRKVEHGEGLQLLVKRALQRPNSPELQGWLTGLIRLLSESYADIMSNKSVLFVPRAISSLATFNLHDPSSMPAPSPGNSSSYFGCCTSRRAAVLLLESLTEIITAFPTSYWSALMTHDTEDRLFPAAEGVVAIFRRFVLECGGDEAHSVIRPSKGSQESEASKEDCVEAALGFCKQVLIIEGQLQLLPNVVTKPVLFPVVAEASLWKAVCGGAVTYPVVRQRLSLIRQAVVSALTTNTIALISAAFLEVFPMLCNLLVPERSHAHCIKEAALIVGLTAAKCPAVRREIRRLVEGYEGWANSICGKIHQVLRHAMIIGAGENSSPVDFVPGEVLVVDVLQTILNDGDQAQHVDMLNEERVAQALLHEQQRRFINHSPASPLDVAFVESFLSPLSRSVSKSHGVTARVRELSTRLALACMLEASNQAFTGSREAWGEGSTAASPQRQPPPQQSPPPTSSVRRNPQANQQQSTPRRGASPAPHQPSPYSSSRYEQWVDKTFTKGKPKTLGSVFEPVKGKTPFRPTSPAVRRGPAGTPPPLHISPVPTANSIGTPRSGFKGGAPISSSSILDAVKEAPLGSDEYLSMAIMMHLPIRFGPHYNRNAKAAVRKLMSPQGVFVQPIHRNNNQSWSASDVRVGELHVVFIPFHKLSCKRIEDEIVTVERHLMEMSKLLVTTPTTQRTRRWFLHDMVNEILPKSELLLRDFLDLLYKFGVEDVVYQMGIIRVTEEGKRDAGDVFHSAVEIADTAMPREILRLSNGAFRDILHSGNIVFTVQQLRSHYFSDKNTSGSGNANEQLSGAYGGQQQWSTLKEVDEEIRKLEQRRNEDTWEQNDSQRREDDVREDLYQKGAAKGRHLDAANTSTGDDDQAYYSPERYVSSKFGSDTDAARGLPNEASWYTKGARREDVGNAYDNDDDDDEFQHNIVPL